MGDRSVGDVLAAITIVALIMVFARPKGQGFDPISLIDGFSTAFQNAVSATYHSVGISAHAPGKTSKAPAAPPKLSDFTPEERRGIPLEPPKQHYQFTGPVDPTIFQPAPNSYVSNSSTGWI